MRSSRNLLILPIILLACGYPNQPAVNNAVVNKSPYERVMDWPALPDHFLLGNPTGIDFDSSGHIVVFHRADRKWPLTGPMPEQTITSPAILFLDAGSGRLIDSWGDSLFIMPHGLLVDDHNNIWVTDVGLHQVFKFSHDGTLLMTLGEARVPGNDSTHFNKPTAVAVAADGSFYVSDGYGNSRVIKFSASGNFLLEWGTKGNKEGQFDIPHGITLDDKGRVYVADRENKRVQVFDAGGKFIQQWSGNNLGNVCAVFFDAVHRQLVAVDDDVSLSGLQHNGSDIIVFDTAGNILSRFGRSGHFDGPKSWYHGVVAGSDGSIYAEDILGNTLQKFRYTGN